MKKALLIGINYIDQDCALDGCINDVKHVEEYLNEKYDDVEFRILIEEDGYRDPTKKNILRGMRWLNRNTSAGDTLFFYYSGHGGQSMDSSFSESDEIDETLIPVDTEDVGDIKDDVIYRKLCRRVKRGVKLVAIFDCCHSGTGMDLAYKYLQRGEYQTEYSDDYYSGYYSSYYFYSNSSYSSSSSSSETYDLELKARSVATLEPVRDPNRSRTRGNVIMISGCKDEQTSQESYINEIKQGALTSTLLEMLRDGADSYQETLQGVRKRLKDAEYEQIPIMSAGRRIDLDEEFSLL